MDNNVNIIRFDLKDCFIDFFIYSLCFVFLFSILLMFNLLKNNLN